MVVGGWVEIVCGFLVAFGLLTRVAAFVASGEMAAAFFMMHALEGSDSLREQGRAGGGLLFRVFLHLSTWFRRLEHRCDDGKRKSLGDDDHLAAAEHRHPFYRR